MELEYIKKEMEEFDFKNGLNSKFLSCRFVCQEYAFVLWNIPHATIKRNKFTPRYRFGKYCLSSVS